MINAIVNSMNLENDLWNVERVTVEVEDKRTKEKTKNSTKNRP